MSGCKSQVGAMADRARQSEDTDRHVFDLEKDERWQARLAEARARREIALREKANGDAPPKPRIKPWEADGQGDLPDFEELEALLAPEEQERLDFADRVKTLRRTVEAEDRDRRPGDNGGPRLPGRQEPVPPPTDIAEVPEDEPDTEAPVLADAARKSEGASVADRYIKALSPDFTPVRPFVPETHDAIGFRPAIASETLSADDSEKLARQYASTMTSLVDAPEAVVAAPAVEARSRRRRGVPLMLLAGVCVLAVLPFTQTVPPLEKGPFSEVSVPRFGLPPALGVPMPMNEWPTPTVSGEWTPVTELSPGGPLAVPLDRGALFQRLVDPVAAVDPGETAFGDLAWTPIAPIAPLPWLASLDVPGTDAPPGATPIAPVPTGTEAAAEAPALPEPLSLLRVTVLVPESRDRAAADGLVEDLEARGHTIGSVKVVNLKISERNLRYYHEEDGAEAARLAEAYGARLRDFTNFRPSPSEGTVEIWLAGEGLGVEEPPQPPPAPQVQVQQVAPVPRVIIVQRQPSLLERLTGGLVSGHQGDGQPDPASGSSSRRGVAPTAVVPDTAETPTVDTGGAADPVPDDGGAAPTTGTGTTGTTTSPDGSGDTSGGSATGTSGSGTATGGSGSTTSGSGTTSGGSGGTSSGTGSSSTGSGTSGGSGSSSGGSGSTESGE